MEDSGDGDASCTRADPPASPGTEPPYITRGNRRRLGKCVTVVMAAHVSRPEAEAAVCWDLSCYYCVGLHPTPSPLSPSSLPTHLFLFVFPLISPSSSSLSPIPLRLPIHLSLSVSPLYHSSSFSPSALLSSPSHLSLFSSLLFSSSPKFYI